MGIVPLPDGAEPLQPADRRGTWAVHLGGAGHDRASSPWSGQPNPSGQTARRGRSRRGLHRGRTQRPTSRSRKKGRLGRRRKLAGAPGRGTLEKDKPPIFGLIQRGAQVVLRMLPNVQQTTIKPVIAASVVPGTLIHTDEYDIYVPTARLGLRPQDGLPCS